MSANKAKEIKMLIAFLFVKKLRAKGFAWTFNAAARRSAFNYRIWLDDSEDILSIANLLQDERSKIKWNKYKQKLS